MAYKVFAMLLVLLGHCFYYKIMTPYGGIDYTNEITMYCTAYSVLELIVKSIYLFHMPLFIAISGMLFSKSIQNNNIYRQIVLKKINRLIIPFVAVCVFYSIPIKFLTGYWNNSDSLFKDIFIGQFLLFGNNHLWYVVSLFWMFCTSYYTSNNKLFHAHKISYCIILIIMSWIGSYIEHRLGNGFGLPAAMRLFIYFEVGRISFAKICALKTNHIYIPLLVIALCIILYIIYLPFSGNAIVSKVVGLPLTTTSALLIGGA